MNLYISHNYRDRISAGNKAMNDVETILDGEGFRNIGLKQTRHRSKAAGLLLNFAGIVKASLSIGRGDTLFLQYPMKGYFTLISRIARMRGARVVALVHDLGSCRQKTMSPEKETRRLSEADHIIATNPVMGKHLLQRGVKRSMGSLGLWDYLTDTDPIPSRVRTGKTDIRIAYAGVLNRRNNRFLWNWGDVIGDYVVDIYGSGFRMDQVARAEKFYNHGFVDAERLIAGMTSDYGLVWEGTSLDSCKGDYGEYLALNTPHKLSLYLRAQLPVIIWSGAAMARFVVDNGIGFTVDRLDMINDRIKEISPEQYSAMKTNVAAMSRKIASGEFLRRAVAEAVSILDTDIAEKKK